MKATERRKSGKGCIDLVEEAMQVLRLAPLGSYAVYYAGAIPFVIGALYFWTEMSQNPIASSRISDLSLIVAVLFIWMRFCQTIFARRIRAQVALLPEPQMKFRQYLGVFLRQLVIQPTGLFLIPMALLLVAPFGWVYAFYQSVVALDDTDGVSISELLQKARKQTMLWPLQNHLALMIVLGFTLFVFLDLTILAIVAPSLIKMLLGIETTFSRSAVAMLNSTMFATMAGVTYLCVDPIIRTIYVLRCYYGQSLATGEDLKAALRQFSVPSKVPLRAGLMALVLACALQLKAQSPPAPTVPSTPPIAAPVSEAELNHNIDEVLQQHKFAWRLPEDVDDKKEQSFIGRFLRKAAETVYRWLSRVMDWIDDLLRRLFASGARRSGEHRFQWVTSSLLLYVLLIAVVVALAFYLVHLRRRKNAVMPLALEAIPLAFDITDESVRADQLPEDSWTALGRDLLEKGEWRLALRAFYLASLANLAKRNLIGIASFKSNREYENELRRRAHSLPQLLPAFGRNLAIFERVWYGTHAVNDELLQEFSTNLQIIRSGS